MSVTFVTTLPFRLLQFVIGIAAVESLSSHFIGVGHCPSYSAASPIISGSRRSTVLQFFPTASSVTTYRKRQSIIFSSRQPYEEADNDGYDDFRPSQQPKFSETSKEEIRLRRMAKNTQNEFPRKSNENFEDDFYAEEGDRGRRENRSRAENGRRNGSRLATYDNSFDENVDYDDDFYDDEDDEDFDEEEPVGGNFWSNPTSRVDNPPAGIARRGRQPQERRYDEDDSRRSPRRPRQQQDGRQRTPARRRAAPRSGLGEPPKIFKDFYNQFFWYGFDADDIAKVGDNNVFGGTKGKFNGFNYLLAEQEENERKNTRSRPSNNSVGRLPPSRNGSGSAITRDNNKRIRRDVEDDYYYNDDDDDIDDDDDGRGYDRVDDSKSKREPLSSSSYTPPTDRASTRYDSIDDYDAYENDNDEYTDNSQTGRKNSARYNDEDEYMDRRSGGRRRRRQQSGSSVPDWSPLNMIESFLGIDREEMDYKADVYNAKMGLGKRKRSSSLSLSEEEKPGRGRNTRRPPLPQRRRSARDDPERQGYAYRYDATLDDDESTPILDIDLGDEVDSKSVNSDSTTRRRQLSLDVDDNDETTKKSKKSTERSWEERQIAMERVPPVDIKAWGPSGEIPMSAREKAFMDAQEDIETARRKLNVMKKKESVAKEEITILKVDAERQRLKLSESPPERRSRRDVDELRQIDLDIDDVSREMRTSRTKVDRALGKLEELEERHHAIMSCYNIDQASLLVGESLNQFSASIQGKSANTSTSTSSSTSNNASTADIGDDIISSSSEIDGSKSDSIQN
jgi:hypothetical protein